MAKSRPNISDLLQRIDTQFNLLYEVTDRRKDCIPQAELYRVLLDEQHILRNKSVFQALKVYLEALGCERTPMMGQYTWRNIKKIENLID